MSQIFGVENKTSKVFTGPRAPAGPGKTSEVSFASYDREV
jgi:hypothetical protein